LVKTAVLYTGGKDSTFALHLAYLQGFEISVLASIIPRYEYSYLYHKPVLDALLKQAYCMGFPIEYIYIDDPGDETSALSELLSRVKDKYGVETIVSGAISSDFQRTVFTMVARRVGLKTYNPLWGYNPRRYLIDLLKYGFEFIIVSISTYGLKPWLLGKVIDLNDVNYILKSAEKYGFNPSFEGGEAETLVLHAPLFKCRLNVEGEIVDKGVDNYEYVVKKIDVK